MGLREDMIHGFVEITHKPVNKETCEDYIEKLRLVCGGEPFGSNLAIKHATPEEYVVMCFFATEEGYEYACKLTHDSSLRWKVTPSSNGRKIHVHGRSIHLDKKAGEPTADSSQGNLRQIDSAEFTLSYSEDKGDLGATAEYSYLPSE
jgi:hypothetical protein